VDPAVIEARYQRAVFRGSEATLQRDFMLRYGASWRELWKASDGASEADLKAAEERSGDLVRLVESRIDDEQVAALYAAYGRNLAVEGELELGMELLGCRSAVERLVRWGLAIHYSDDVVAAPPYLARLLLEISQRARAVNVDVWSELKSCSDGGTLAFLEGMLARDFNESLHEAFYGRAPVEVRVGSLAVYRSGVGLVVNPARSAGEILNALLQLKQRRAGALARALSLHGEYEFSRDYRCGMNYLSVDGSAEGSGVIAICPWLSYSRKLWRLRNLVIVVKGRRPREPPRLKCGVVFIEGGEAEIVRPSAPSKLFDHVLDLLYSAGFSVAE
jgi:hypothetical protein